MVAEPGSVVAMAVGDYYLAMLSLPLIAMHLYSASRRKGTSDREVLLFSRRLSAEMGKGHGIGVALGKEPGKGGLEAEFSALLQRHRLGETELVLEKRSGNRHADELMELVALSLNTGADIRKALELFSSRLEHEIGVGNRLNAKTGGMKTLTYAGLVFFLPLFGGISSGILGTSLGSLNAGSLLFQQRFLAIMAAYTTMLLYISVAFGSPESEASENLYSMMPLAVVSLFVLLLTAHYAANIL